MRAHLADLRVEVRELSGDEREAWLECLARDWRLAGLPPAEAALCAYAERLTRAPAEMAERDVAGLRALGFDDQAIHLAIQIVAYFNYINRVADAVHVDLESDMPPRPGNDSASHPREGARPSEY